MKTIIIIPTYNEAQNIEKLISKIFALKITDLELIIVDDNSPDGTAEIIHRLQASPRSNLLDHSLGAKVVTKTSSTLHLIERSHKLGLGSAYIAGFTKALDLGASYILEMDADFSHNPDDIPRLLDTAKHVDLVIGSRKVQDGKIIGWSWRRKFQSNAAMWLSRKMLGLSARDVTAGFRCFRRTVLKNIDLNSIKSNGYAFQEELLYRTQKAGFKIIEIPVTFVDRQKGSSKLSKKDIIEFFIIIFKLKFLK